MKKILVTIFLLAPLVISGQNISRGYKLLEKPDFEKAEEIFQESWASGKNKASSALALAFIYADERSPYFDLIQSWQYATETKPLLKELSNEEIEIIGEYFINTETRRSSRPVISKIEYGLEAIEASLIKYVREENNLDIVYEVLERFPDFRYYNNVVHIRNHLEFRKYEKQHTIKGYMDFLERFPDAAQIEKARKYLRKLELEAILNSPSVKSLKSFLVKYPETAEYNTALRELHNVAFMEAIQNNTFEALETFIDEYPNAAETAEAVKMLRQRLYEQAKSIKTLEAYNDFILRYPEGEYFIDIFNLKSSDLGNKYLATKPPQTGKTIWARVFEDPGFAASGAVTVIDNTNNLITGASVREPSGEREDVWIIKTTEGEMVWNRRIAEELNMNIRFLETDNSGNIIGVGESWATSNGFEKETRIFSLNANGLKKWSKTVGLLEPESLLITKKGGVVMAGYIRADSISICGVMFCDSSGREVITRGYSVNDTIKNIIETDNGNFIISGNSWISEIDSKGHIVWETSLSGGTRINSAAMLTPEIFICSGTRDNKGLLIIKDLLKGTSNEKVIESTGKLLVINNKTIALGHLSNEGYTIDFIIPADGSVIKTVELTGINLSDMETGSDERFVYTIVENGQVILIKNELEF